jgi:hypothetical protein
MWLRTVDSLDHSMRLWCEPQSHASFAQLEAGAARLWTRPLVYRCYIQRLYSSMWYVCCYLDVFYYIKTNGYYFIY